MLINNFLPSFIPVHFFSKKIKVSLFSEECDSYFETQTDLKQDLRSNYVQ